MVINAKSVTQNQHVVMHANLQASQILPWEDQKYCIFRIFFVTFMKLIPLYWVYKAALNEPYFHTANIIFSIYHLFVHIYSPAKLCQMVSHHRKIHPASQIYRHETVFVIFFTINLTNFSFQRHYYRSYLIWLCLSFSAYPQCLQCSSLKDKSHAQIG